MKEIKIEVNGMVCEGCEKRVEKTVKTIKGIKKVTADHISGIVTVLAKEEITESQIKEKIENIGFEVV